MREISYTEALREGLREEMLRDERVFLLGEDIGRFGGINKVTKGLWEEFGPERVRDTPISESAFMGIAVGAAITGTRPVVEFMFADFICLAMDQIVNQATKIRYIFGGQAKVPIVIRAPIGGGRSTAAQHSQSLESWFIHVPGLKVVLPSTPYDAKGLLKTAIRDENPVMFFEPRLLYPSIGPVPNEDYAVPFGEASVKREGDDVTIIAGGWCVPLSMNAAKKLSEEGISVEVIDPRTLVPLDEETIVESVTKTGRAVVVEQDCKRGGWGAEVVAVIVEKAFDYLDAPINRVACFDVPIPFSKKLERYVLPDEDRIIEAVRQVMS